MAYKKPTSSSLIIEDLYLQTFLHTLDFPPPIGFIWLVLLILILDVVQSYYLKLYFLKHIENKKKIKLFSVNFLFYLIGGLITAISTSMFHFNTSGLANTLLWSGVVTFVGVFYGIVFFIFNIILFKRMKVTL